MKKLLALLLAVALTVPVMAMAQTTWDSEDLSWKKNTQDAKFSLYLNMTWAPFDVWGTDHVSQQVTKDTGISFDVTMQQNAQHLATIVATGELPDAVFVYGGANIDMMEDYNVCYAWDELIPKYCPEFMDLIDKSEIQMATKEDGHFYTLYTHVRNQEYWDDPTQGVTYGQATISFRDDIMAELGNPEINTTEDFYNVLKQVKEKYPDMIPYLQQKLNGDYVAWSFGIDYDGTQDGATIDENGNAVWTYSEQKPISEYLEFENALLREGLMSQEGLTYTFEQAKAAILSGNVFCWAGQCYDVDQVNEALDALDGEKLYYTSVNKPLTVNGETRMDMTYASPGFAGFYITRACKDPGRLIALMEYMKSPYGDHLTQWGVEGLDYELKNGYPIQYPTYSWKERGDNVWYFQATFASENMKALAAAANNERFGQVAKLVIDYKPYWKYNLPLAMCSNAVANTPEGDIKATLDSLKANAFSAAITAKTEEECKQIIATYFSDIEKAGLATYNAFINQQYQTIKSNLAK
jgi:putative aldouronate transport system substrate-binding protein